MRRLTAPAATPTHHELLNLTALAQATLIRRGEISSVALTKAYLREIKRQNPELTALVSITGTAAIRAARRADRAQRHDAPVFHGVPTGIKDIDMVAGTFTKGGSRAMRYLYTPIDGRLARQVKKGGYVVTGKTATSELAILPMTEPDIHPPTRNPWHRDHTAGGSSGGAAAAVASGMLPIAHASDGAGSIRIPAAFCGLFGMKPSRGLTPNYYSASDNLGLSCTGSVTRNVADAAAMLDVLRGEVFPHRNPESLLQQSERDPGKLKIRLITATPLADVAPEIAAATERMAQVLADLGHTIVPAAWPDLGTVEDFIPIMARTVANVPMLNRKHLQPLTAWMHRLGSGVSKRQAKQDFEALSAKILAWFEGCDLLLTPTSPVAPPKIGALNHTDPKQMFAAASKLGVLTAPFNISGQPAASIPAGLSTAGLPIGVQIVGPRHGDVRVLQVARQLEQAAPWPQMAA